MSATSQTRRGSPFSEPPRSPFYPPSPPARCPPSPEPTTADEDEYTLTAFGDISLNVDCFIPSLPGNAIQTEDLTIRPCPRPLTGRPRSASANRPRPQVLLPKPENKYLLIVKAQLAHPQLSLKDAIASVNASQNKRRSRVPAPIKVVPRSPNSSVVISPGAPATPSTPALSPTSSTASPSPVTPRTPATPKLAATPSTPKSPQKPFRGNGPLPKRLPLPNWDLVYPDLAKETKAPVKSTT